MSKILVIEDNDDSRETIIDILQFKGFETAAASSGKIGLQLAQEFHPDLIICDVMMPELSGYKVLEALRQNPEMVDVPFIFVTALGSMQELRKGMDLGADDYLTKPLKMHDLLAAIATRLHKNEQQNDHQSNIIHAAIANQQASDRQVVENPRLTPLQNRILQLVAQSKAIGEIADELAVSIDAAELLTNITMRLNRRLNLNNQSDNKKPDNQKIEPLPTQENPISIHEDLLTPRQREVLKLVANGMTTKEIANSLFISVKTVETHRGQLMERLNIHDLAGLIRYAIRTRLINLDDDED